MRGSAKYERLRARHERLWQQLYLTELQMVDLIGRASGTDRGADAMRSESHGNTDRIVACFPENLSEAVEDARWHDEGGAA